MEKLGGLKRTEEAIDDGGLGARLSDALMAADGLRVVFEYGFEIGDESFVELTADQYAAFEDRGGDVSKRWFRLTRGIFEERNNPPVEVPTVDEAAGDRLTGRRRWDPAGLLPACAGAAGNGSGARGGPLGGAR